MLKLSISTVAFVSVFYTVSFWFAQIDFYVSNHTELQNWWCLPSKSLMGLIFVMVGFKMMIDFMNVVDKKTTRNESR